MKAPIGAFNQEKTQVGAFSVIVKTMDRFTALVVLIHSSSSSIFLHVQDHRACWKMQYRGSLGESLLHILIMGNSLIHTKIARTLIRHFPNTVIDVIEVMMIDGHRTKFIA